MSRSKVKPRLMHMPDVLVYMGVTKRFFDTQIRNRLTEIKFGYKTIAFEVDEVDRLIDTIKKGDKSCHKNYTQESVAERTDDTKSTKSTPQGKVTKLSVYEKWLTQPK
jgi:hypothetical protein